MKIDVQPFYSLLKALERVKKLKKSVGAGPTLGKQTLGDFLAVVVAPPAVVVGSFLRGRGGRGRGGLPRV